MNHPQFFRVRHFVGKRRLGVPTDGGYVIGMLDGEYDCYISCGISNEESFSRDFINAYNMKKENNFGFDGTINCPNVYISKESFPR